MAAQEEDRAVNAVVNEELGYPIVVGSGLTPAIARFLRGRGPDAIVLCDRAAPVTAIARRIAARLRPRPRVLPFELGERRKRLATVEEVLHALHAAGVERQTLVLGVGGGVASDLFGFAAATYARGLRYAHVATTLVAMADAAIGGKTGVDLESGKNLAGAFNDPLAVFCEVEALDTLPFALLREGLAEVLKAAIIAGDPLFEALEELSPHLFSRWPWVPLTAAAVNVKTRIVAADPRETGARELLNLGHTFAHGIEQASAFRVSHGAAVALGLRAAGLLALRTGRFSERGHLRVLALLTLLGMPLRTSVAPERIFAAMRGDKKRRDGRLRFVLPRAIGEVEFGVECEERDVRAVLERLVRMPAAVTQ